MQSARFVASAALQRGRIWLDSFGPDQRADAAITGFAGGRVCVAADDGLEEGAVRVRLTGSRGDLDLRRDFPHGDARDPLASAEVRDKAARCLAAGLEPGQVPAALSALTGLGSAPGLGTFTSAVTR